MHSLPVPHSPALLSCDGCCTESEHDQHEKAVRDAQEAAWRALLPRLEAMAEQWAWEDAHLAPLEQDPEEAAEDAARWAEHLREQPAPLPRPRRRRVTGIDLLAEPVADTPAPRQPSDDLRRAFGVLPPLAEEEQEETTEEVTDDGPPAVLAPAQRKRDLSAPITAQETLHAADREVQARTGVPAWRKPKRAAEAPWVADVEALPESVRHLARMTYADGRHALVGAATSLAMSALHAGWTPLQVERLLQDRSVPISVLCTHREPGGSQAGRPRSAASTLQHARKIVSQAQHHLDNGAPLSESGAVPDVVRQLRQVILEHSWRGPRGRTDLAVLHWLMRRAEAVHQVVLHASARETGLAVGVSSRSASRALKSLRQSGFLSLSTDNEQRQHDGEDALSYRLRVPVTADRFCITAGQSPVCSSRSGAGTPSDTFLIGNDPLISKTSGRSPEQWVKTDQTDHGPASWVQHGAALMEWVMAHDLWTRDGVGHSAARIAWELHERGEAQSQRDLAQRTGMSQSTVSGHLKSLRRAGLVHAHAADLLQPLTQEVLDAALESRPLKWCRSRSRSR